MKLLANKILVLSAEIAAVRFLRSGAASADLAAFAVEREQMLTREVAELQREAAQQAELFEGVPEAEPLPLAASQTGGGR
jgi:phage shock protein A